MESKSFYDATAGSYNSRHDNDTAKYIRKKEKGMIRKHATGRVADIGCGTGCHMNAERVGIDISRNMLMECKSSKNLVQARAEELPAKAGAFDSSTCMFSTLNLCDAYRAVEEMRRVLRKGGVAVVSVSGLRDSGKKERNVRIEGFRIRIAAFTSDGLTELFRKSGFELLELRGFFKAQRPYWGWHRDFSIKELIKLEVADRLLPDSMGRFYITAFRKL